jgi:hypothetical protein
MSASGFSTSFNKIRDFVDSTDFFTSNLHIVWNTLFGVHFNILDYVVEIDDADIDIFFKHKSHAQKLEWNVRKLHSLAISKEFRIFEDEELREARHRICEKGLEILQQVRTDLKNDSNLPDELVFDIIQAIIEDCHVM